MSLQINGSCKACGGKFEFQYCDMKHIYVRCRHCDFGACYTFLDEEEAHRFAEEENREILDRLRASCIDWELTLWDQLHDDVVSFINTHPYVESDIRFHLAKIACITRGFHIMDEEIYERCHGRFAVADSIYRVLVKAAKEKAEDLEMSATLDEYQEARHYYIALQAEYVAVKTAKKAVKVVLKHLTKPLIPPLLPF